VTEPAFPALARLIREIHDVPNLPLFREQARKDLEAARELLAASTATYKAEFGDLSNVAIGTYWERLWRAIASCLPPSLGSRDKSGGQLKGQTREEK
jgi:hypothetical protein